MPKDGQGSFSSKHCHDNYWYYVHPKNGMASLDMSERERGRERDSRYRILWGVYRYLLQSAGTVEFNKLEYWRTSKGRRRPFLAIMLTTVKRDSLACILDCQAPNSCIWLVFVVVYQVALSTCEKKVAFCKLYTTEVEREPTVLYISTDSFQCPGVHVLLHEPHSSQASARNSPRMTHSHQWITSIWRSLVYQMLPLCAAWRAWEEWRKCATPGG